MELFQFAPGPQGRGGKRPEQPPGQTDQRHTPRQSSPPEHEENCRDEKQRNAKIKRDDEIGQEVGHIHDDFLLGDGSLSSCIVC